MNLNFSRREIIISIGSILTTLIVSFTTAYFTNYLDKGNDLLQFKKNAEVAFQDRRLDLIERLLKLTGEMPAINDIWNEYSDNPTSSLSKELGDYRAEFNVVVGLSNLMFGPETNKLATEIIKESQSKPWWEIKEETYNNLITKMLQELDVNLQT